MHIRVCLSIFVAFVLIVANFCATTEATKVIFYNQQPSVRKSQLLSTQIMSQPCPRGKMRDHRNRCRRAVIFSRKHK
ncbi:PREDICTED: uncharacterized protein LOC108969218 [Bactrocera latifrons]|uniref:uncharacterized protein LOC108969218 n=1 Tax=Bactrocera latifrons TaxID=174628 RepID=UPI0008DD4C33|nr:PREDICTED: uncharacterized protein LOC108969218 [Bactrocera latifrons]